MIERQRKFCTKCASIFDPSKAIIKWDEHGLGYSTKLAICPNCGNLVVIKIIEDSGLDINTDPRFYNCNSSHN